MFQTKEDRVSIIRACEIANKMLLGDEFYLLVKAAVMYDDSNATSSQLVSLIKKYRTDTIKVELVKPWYRFSKMRAVFNSSRPNVLGLNKYRKPFIESLVGTIIHEYMHYIDHREDEFTMGHGSNSSKGKAGTVPYALGRKAKYLCIKKYHKTPAKKKSIFRLFNPLSWF